MLKKEKIKILIAFGFSIVLFFVFFLTSQIKPINTSPPPNLPKISVEEKGEGQATLEVSGVKYQNKIIENESVYNFMSELQKERKINFKDENYTGMGKLIEEINGVKNSGEKNWIYYVNGTLAQVGVSNYKIKSGDIVSWKYETNY